MGPRPPDLSATPSHTPAAPAAGGGHPAPASPPTSLRPQAAPAAQQESGRRPGRGGPLPRPRVPAATPFRPACPFVRPEGGTFPPAGCANSRGVGEEEGPGRERGGAGRAAECRGREPPPHTRLPSRPARGKRLLWTARESPRNDRRGAGWCLPLGGSRHILPGRGAAEAGGVRAGPSAEPAAALGGRARLSGGEGRRVGRGGAGPGRGETLRPRLRLPLRLPPQPGPRGRAGTRVPPGGRPAPGARRCEAARACALGRHWLARGSRDGRQTRWGRGRGEKRRGSADSVTAGCRSVRDPEGCREARRPLVCKVFLTASQTTVAHFFPTATSGESCPLLTFYPRVPKDGILS